jgi:hypothetical protein
MLSASSVRRGFPATNSGKLQAALVATGLRDALRYSRFA